MVDWKPITASGGPALPSRLAGLLRHETLPAWAAQCCGLPAGSSVEALSRISPPSEPAARSALDFFTAELVRKHKQKISPFPVLPDDSELPGDALASGDWPARLSNALSRGSQWKTASALAKITYGDLLSLRGVGVKYTLDAAIRLEALAVQSDTATFAEVTAQTNTRDVDAILSSLKALLEEGWTDSVYGTDPRWRDLLPEGNESLAAVTEYILHRYSVDSSTASKQPLLSTELYLNINSPAEVANWCHAIKARYEQLASLPLEISLSNLLETCTGFKDKRKQALLARLGWAGKPPVTLEAAGQMLEVTRERIRQIEISVKKKLPPPPVLVPALSRALECLAAATPISTSEAANLLRESKVSEGRFSPESVMAAASDLGLDCPVTITKAKRVAMVTRTDNMGHVAQILRLARKKSGAAGVVNSAEVAAQVTRELSAPCLASEVEAVLSASPLFRQVGEKWFWATDLPAGRNRVVNMCRKMLSVTAPISVRGLREGLRREFTFRNLSSSGRLDLHVPPAAVLRSFLTDHPDFAVSKDDSVRPNAVLDYRVELGESDQTIVDVLRSSPAIVLDRASLVSGCVARGINPQTANTDLTYSCVVEHLDTNIWTLRGADVNPAAVEAVRQMNALRPKERRVRDFGWTTSGRLWIAAVVPAALQTFVFSCPGGAREMLAGQKFDAHTADGLPCGKIGVTSNGTIYGHGPFVELSGADEGDILIVEFSLVEQSARLLQGDEELLESYSSD